MQFPNFLGKVNYLPTGQLILFSTITVLSLILLQFIWVLATNYCYFIYFTPLRFDVTLFGQITKIRKSDAAFIKESSKIYCRLTKEAIQHIDQLDSGEHICSKNAKKLVNNYCANRFLQFKITYETEYDSNEVGHEAEALLSKVLNYERNRLHEMRSRREVSEEIYIRTLSKIDRDEVGFASCK